MVFNNCVIRKEENSSWKCTVTINLKNIIFKYHLYRWCALGKLHVFIQIISLVISASLENCPFFLKREPFLLFFCSFFNENVKLKCKATFSKILIRFYLLCISNKQDSKLRALQKYIPSKKIKDFIGYGALHLLYKLINRLSEYIFLLC